MAQDPRNELLVKIHDLIDETFDREEFRDLCVRLGIKYDNLRGETLSSRIHDLVQQMDRHRRLDDLLNFCARLRPYIDWPDLFVPVELDAVPAPFSELKRNPRQIFLSHARQDADFAHRLANDLHRHGWQIWIAPDSIHPGEKWVDAINRGLAESGIFVLALTPDAVSSTWVHSETNVAISLQHQEVLRFIPLDVKPAAAPPLWQAYQWIPFQSDYKSGLERLLQELQPEKVAQVVGLYRQLQEAMGRREWAVGQRLGAEIIALYPDYRETELQISLAQQGEAREKRQQAEAAKLYDRVQRAYAAADWTVAQDLIRQVEALVPNYRDVGQLAARARRGQRQNRRDAISQTLRRIPVWGWGGGVVVVAFTLFFFFQLAGGGDERPTITPTMTIPAVGLITPETPTMTATPEPTWTIAPTDIVEPEPADTQEPTHTATPTPPPTPGIGSTRIRLTDEAVMVYVPEGEFMMGSEAGEDDEKPVHAVYLDSYWIDQTEVTNGMYAECERASICDRPPDLGSYTHESYYPNPDYADYPVIYVSWENAKTYCEWAGGRLPTEAEWEKAARWDEENQEAYIYPWGNDFDGTRLNFCDSNCSFDWKDDTVNDGYEDTAPVGSYPDSASPYGALDMAGNVWEWVNDVYDADYYDLLVYDNPKGSTDGNFLVLRGGSWSSGNDGVRTADRSSSDPANRSSGVGFRCAQE